MKKRSKSKKRLPGAFFGTLALITATFALTVYTQARLQVFDRKNVLAKAEDAWMLERERLIDADRGGILTSDGRVLAHSKPVYDFWVFYNRVPCSPGFFMSLADAAGIPVTSITAPFIAGRDRVWLPKLDSAAFNRVKRVKSKWGADGVSLEKMTDREYPFGAFTVAATGYFHEGRPKSGVELLYDEQLKGVDGHKSGVVGLDGKFNGTGTAVVKGSDVVLTLDSRLQTVASYAVRNAVESNDATSGAIIVMRPSTGDILAMANWPTFDPGIGPKSSYQLMTPYMEDLEPGSTFKVLTLAKALESGAVDVSYEDVCVGSFHLGGSRYIKCDDHGNGGAHGTVDLEHAIAESCNISAAKWALAIGRDGMIDFLRDTGMLDRSGIGLSGEAAPLFEMNAWDKERQLATLGFGQSIAVSPLVLAAALNVIANDGVYVPPRLVSMVGKKPMEFGAKKRVFSEETARQVRAYMESVVQEKWGTADALAIPGYRIAGKTGTAQKLGSGGGNVSSFVGMFPADRPEVLILVVINDPKSGQFYGSTVAGPAFREVALAAIGQLEIPGSPEPDDTSEEQE